MEGFWNVHDKNVTEASHLLRRYFNTTQYFNQTVLADLWQCLRSLIPHRSSPADTPDYSDFCPMYNTRTVTHGGTRGTHTACLEMSNSDLLQKIPLPPRSKLRFMKHLCSHSTPSVL